MGTSLIEVGNIGSEDATELLLVQDEQVIETLPAHTPQEALAAGVGARSADWCLEQLDARSACHTRKERAKLCAIVPDQESGRLPKWRSFSQLLGNPSIGGMAGHCDVDDFSALQFDVTTNAMANRYLSRTGITDSKC
jgi:hypothetical protein